MLLLPVVRECFDPSRRKQDFELRIEQLQLQLQDVVDGMQALITQLRRNVLLLDGGDRISLRRIRANGIAQLAWQFHEIRSGVWCNGRHGAMQVLMPVEALGEDLPWVSFSMRQPHWLREKEELVDKGGFWINVSWFSRKAEVAASLLKRGQR